MQINLEKEKLISFLKTLDVVSQQAPIKFSQNKIESIISTPDNTLFLYNEWSTTEDDFEVSDEVTLYIPDTKRLLSLVRHITDGIITLSISNNSIKYKSKEVKFTYHLFEEGLLAPCQLKPEKIKSFDTDFTFQLNRQQYQTLVKSATFTGDVNKIYFYTQGGSLYAEITDRAKHNIDSFCFCIGDIEEENQLQSISLNFDNFKLMQSNWDNCLVRINQKLGVCLVDIVENEIKSTYIFTSYKQ